MLKEKLMGIIDLKEIEIDFDDFMDDDNRPTEVANINAMGFDGIAWAIRKFKHVTDWDEGRIIILYSECGKFTLYYVNDCISAIYAEDLPLSWHFANKRANILSREELIELFIG
jgi:hypothetical protein